MPGPRKDKDLSLMSEHSRPVSLNTVEYATLRKLQEACQTLAMSKSRHDAVLSLCDDWSVEEREAELWLQKAEDYMAMRAPESVDASRQMYHTRMEQLLALCMEHLVADDITIIQKPTRLIVENKDTGEQTVRTEMVNHIKTRPRVLNTAALKMAKDIADSIASLGGVRLSSPGAKVGTVNVQINNPASPAADNISQLSVAQLAGLIGAEVDDEDRFVDAENKPQSLPIDE